MTNAVALVWIDDTAPGWPETVTAVAALPGLAGVRVCLGPGAGTGPSLEARERLAVFRETALGVAVRRVFAQACDLCLCVVAPVAPPEAPLGRALAWLADDPRIATVSFLSNAAGYLSFPERNRECASLPGGLDPVDLTRRLRRTGPDSGPVPIACPEGAAVLLHGGAFDAAGGLADRPGMPVRLVLAEFGLRASRRGFLNVLDAGTFVERRFGPGERPGSPLADPAWRRTLHGLHGFFPGLHDAQAAASDSEPLALAWGLARAKVFGLDVLLDASVLGPREMGSQRHLVSLATALAARPEIRSLTLGVPDPGHVPAYAASLAACPKITLIRAGRLDFSGAPPVDILHRTYQPTRRPIPWRRWRALARRTVITVQDLIAYRNGAYHKHWRHWRAYRANLVLQLGRVDGVLTISGDVRDQLTAERLPYPAATVVVPLGCDHPRGGPAPAVPAALAARGWKTRPFLLLLGADFAHKNRDLGIRVWKRLRERGHDLGLVLAGPAMGQGADREAETAILAGETEMLRLEAVATAERDWLLSRAVLVLYPTAAEGFGLVPFEAAAFGRPCLAVSFGPLRELIGDPLAPTTFTVGALADRAETLLTEAAARQAVAVVRKQARRYLWSDTAAATVAVYFRILGQPARDAASRKRRSMPWPMKIVQFLRSGRLSLGA